MSSYRSHSDLERWDPRYSSRDSGRTLVFSNGGFQSSGNGNVQITQEMHLTRKITFSDGRNGPSSSSNDFHHRASSSRPYRSIMPTEYPPSIYSPSSSSRCPSVLGTGLDGSWAYDRPFSPRVDPLHSRSEYSRFDDPHEVDSDYRSTASGMDHGSSSVGGHHRSGHHDSGHSRSRPTVPALFFPDHPQPTHPGDARGHSGMGPSRPARRRCRRPSVGCLDIIAWPGRSRHD